MRLIQVLISESQQESVTDLLDDEGVDYVQLHARTNGDDRWLVEFPVPSDAIGYFLDRLKTDTGLEDEQYTLITSLESAMSPSIEPLQERFANDFDPLTRHELRGKARDMSRDPTSFIALIVLSAIIAAAGLLIDSPAVVVGSMVIAPIVGPVLTAAVGGVTGDRRMVLESIWLQAAGLGVAIASAGVFGYGLQLGGFFPPSLDISTIDLIGLRTAPNLVTVVIGLAAGAAAAFGLTTKGPTSVIGVMIAAALIPAAATVGLATAWAQYRIALGSLILLLLTMVVINVGAFAILWQFRYRPEREGWLFPDRSTAERLAVLSTAVIVVVLLVFVGIGTYEQTAFERTVTDAVHSTFDQPEYDGIEPVTTQIEYSGSGPFATPETITVVASRTDGSDPPQAASELDRRISEASGRDVIVRVRFVEYQRSDEGPPSRALERASGDRFPTTPKTDTARVRSTTVPLPSSGRYADH